jgi:hypothetical protein
MTRQTRAPRPGPLDTDRQHLAMAAQPPIQIPISNRGRVEARSVEEPAEFVEHRDDMHILMGIDTANHTRRRIGFVGHHGVPPVLLKGHGGKQQPGGWTGQGVGLIAQAPLRSHVRPTGCLP